MVICWLFSIFYLQGTNHWSYECKQERTERPYVSQPSRSKKLKINLKESKKTTAINESGERVGGDVLAPEDRVGFADRILQEKSKERQRKLDFDTKDDKSEFGDSTNDSVEDIGDKVEVDESFIERNIRAIRQEQEELSESNIVYKNRTGKESINDDSERRRMKRAPEQDEENE